MPTKTVPKKDLTTGVGFIKSTMYNDSWWTPYNPDSLVRKFGGNAAGLDKYQKMKQDDAVKSALYTKKSVVVASGWRIEPASEEEKDIEIAKFIKDNLNDWYGGSEYEAMENFDSGIMEILSAMEYGFSVTEKIYGQEDGVIFLKKLRTLPPQSIEFHSDDHGNLDEGGLQQWDSTGGLISLPINKFIIFINNREAGNWYGESDLRAAYRSWFSKDILIKFWNIYLERFGNPLIVAKYGKTASKGDRTSLSEMLNNLQSKTSFILPEEVEIEIKETMKSSGGDFDVAIKTHNDSIRNSILMPKGLGFGDSSSGSYAKSKVEQDVFSWIVEPIRKNLQTVINAQIIRQLIDLNFEGVDIYPKFVFNPISEEDKGEKAKIVIEAIKSGAISPDFETENHLRVLLGVPEKEIEEKEEEPIEEEIPIEEKEEPREFKLSRELTTYEKKMNFSQISKVLVSDVDGYVVEVKELLSKIRDDYTTQVIRKKIIEQQNVSLAYKQDFRFIRDLGLLIESILRKSYEGGNQSAKTAKKNYAQTATKIGFVESKASMWIKNKSKILTADIAGNLQNSCKSILSNGIKRGASTAMVINEVEDEFAKYISIEGVDGGAYTSGRLYTEVNTAYAEAFSVGMDEFNKPLEEAGEIQAYQWSSIMDKVTTKGCDELNGNMYSIDNAYWNDVAPPRHWNCRSLKVPIYRGESWTESPVLNVHREF